MAYTSALVIQQNASIFPLGNITPIPTPATGGRIDCDYWATPVVGFGIVGKGFIYKPCQPTDLIATAPDPQSFHVVRIISQTESTDWYVVGTSTQYNAAAYDAEVGHSSPPVLMPQTLSAFLPSQNICNQTLSGFYFGVLAAPTPLGALHYYANGIFNGVALPAITNQASAGALLTALNANWGAVGTWTLSADNVTFIVTQSAGTGNDVLAAAITMQ